MSISQIALAGMDRVQANVERVAQRLAKTDISSDAVGAEDVVSLSVDMAQLASADNEFAALAKAMEAEKQMAGALISLLG
ncbi:MAG: hypothetical protein K2Q23_07720 [Bryobacteraceae bacterium]|nr:hypothetical protein [Bryobacteraceae bacterium]